MNRRVAIIVITTLVLGAIVGILFMKNPAKAPSESANSGTNSSQNQQTNNSINAPVETDQVSIKDFAFSPVAITVKKGTKVTWTNNDATRHSVTPDNETADFKASELLSQGATYSVTYNDVGTFTYHCTPHPYMKASVTVTE